EDSEGFLSVSLALFDVESLSSKSGRLAELVPSLTISDFGLTIYQKGTTNIIQEFEVGMIPLNAIPLMDGEYTAVLKNHMDDNLTVGDFTGSEDFTIVPQQQTTIDVTVSLQEMYFTFTLLENFYTTHHITVANDSGLVVVSDQASQYSELYLPTLAVDDTYVFSVVNNTTGATIGSTSISGDQKGQGYNLRITQLTGEGILSLNIDPIDVQDDDFELVPGEVIGFTDAFEGTNWLSTANGSATIYSFSSTSLSFNCPSGGGGFVSEIAVPEDGTISFDWTMVIRTAGDYGDRFGYSINGTAVELTTSGGGSGNVANIAVNQGDVFSFSSWGTTQRSSYYGDIQNFVFQY
ncbi:MAG: DUF4493 domain-containing protein, partial [Bacteroidota bacterium]